MSFDRETWVGRMEQGCLALENMFPTTRLLVARGDYLNDPTSNRDFESDATIEDRARYFSNQIKKNDWCFSLYNGIKAYINPGIPGGCIENGHVGISGGYYKSEERIYQVNISFQSICWEQCEAIFVTVGDALGAYTSCTTPLRAFRTLRAFQSVTARGNRSRHESNDDPISREAAPLLSALAELSIKLPVFSDYPLAVRDHPAQPKELGWLNYWSEETCQYLGFPDAERDQDILAHSYRTPGGAWLVKLCADPLDLDRPAHVKIFADIYERFPKIGIRAAPKEPLPPVRYPEHTTYIKERDPYYIIERLIPFMRERGWKLVERLPKSPTPDYITMGLIRGTPGWTIIKTLPEKFWSLVDTGKQSPLLAELCRDIRRNGFSLNVYSDIEAELLESDDDGNVHRSGFVDADEASEEFEDNGYQTNEFSPVLEFKIHPVKIDILDLDNCGQITQQVRDELADRNADLCDDQRFLESLNNGFQKQRQGIRLIFVPLSR